MRAMITSVRGKYQRFSAAYLRWRQQLTALDKGNYRRVRHLAFEAKQELEAKRRGTQLRLVH